MSGGGDSLDIVAYLFSPAGVGVNFATGTTYGGGGRDRFIGFNAILGSQYDDYIKGTTGEQWFVPLAGDDRVYGGAGTTSSTTCSRKASTSTSTRVLG